MTLCTFGVFSTTVSLTSNTFMSKPSDSQAAVASCSSSALKAGSTHARATTRAPPSGVRLS